MGHACMLAAMLPGMSATLLRDLSLPLPFVAVAYSLRVCFCCKLACAQWRIQVCKRDFARERLRRVLRKKTSAELRLIYIFTSSPLHIHILTYISAHLHIYIHNCTSTSLHIFTSSHRHLCSSSSSHIYISAHVHICASTSLLIFASSHLHLTSLPLIYISHLHLSLFLTFSLKAGGSAAGPPRNATLCGDRACRGREMQARVRFDPVRRNPLRRSRVSSARNSGESAI